MQHKDKQTYSMIIHLQQHLIYTLMIKEYCPDLIMKPTIFNYTINNMK